MFYLVEHYHTICKENENKRNYIKFNTLCVIAVLKPINAINAFMLNQQKNEVEI